MTDNIYFENIDENDFEDFLDFERHYGFDCDEEEESLELNFDD